MCSFYFIDFCLYIQTKQFTKYLMEHSDSEKFLQATFFFNGQFDNLILNHSNRASKNPLRDIVVQLPRLQLC